MKKLFAFLQIPATPKHRVVENYISELNTVKNKTYIIESTKGYFTIDGCMKKFIRFQDAFEVAKDIENGILGMNIKSIQWQMYKLNKVNNEHKAIV